MKLKVIIPIIIVLIVGYSAAYVVDETEQVVITQFGEAIGEPKTEPGLYFKLPIIQKANYFPKNLLEWDGDRGQVPTKDKKFIWVDTFARWKIVEPLKFFQSVGTLAAAQSRLDDILDAAVRNLITSYPLIETVRWTNRELDTYDIGIEEYREDRVMPDIKVGRQSIINKLKEQAVPKLQEFGIELVDIKIKRLNYVEQVKRSVYDRMIAEREQIAEKFRSEGKGEARKIEGNMEKELKQIQSEAYRKAQEIKGEAEAKATEIYAEAYQKGEDFYSFMKTLEIYKDTMDEKSSLILSTDSDFLKYFKSYNPEE